MHISETVPPYDPLSPDQLRNPHGWLDHARREHATFYSEEFGFWCVTRYKEVERIYRETTIFSNQGTHASRVPVPAEITAEFGELELTPAKGALNDTDPPRHTRIRKALQPHFTKKAIKQQEPMIQEVADALVDSFENAGRCDIVEEFAAPLAARVVARLLGADPADAGKFKEWADARFRLAASSEAFTHDDLVFCWRKAVEFDRYVEALVAERRTHARDDLTSKIIHAKTKDGTPALTEDEALANVWGTVIAGSDTSALLIAHTLYLLLTHRERWEEITRSPDAIPNAVEETMRFMGPVRGAFRRTTREVKLGGVTIPQGAEVYLHLTSTGRDDDVFACPHAFKLDRSNAGDHLGFGIGAHFCIGAGLGRTEARIAIATLVRRLPAIRLAIQNDDLEFLPSHLVVGIKTLPVVW